jgi:hypothetical protein
MTLEASGEKKKKQTIWDTTTEQAEFEGAI